MSPEEKLDHLFAEYRAACPEMEFRANFMPEIWRRIEAGRSFWPIFENFARVALTMCAFACLLFALLDFAGSRHSVSSEQTYADALAAEQTSEANFYADAVRTTPAEWNNSR